MDSSKHCAFNATRESLLGADVVAGEFSAASLVDWMPKLTPNSGTGLWMAPFRGIPATDVRVPLDLVYLDTDCRVLDLVEFFPHSRVSPSTPPAASVLALPSHTIYSSHTCQGDQVMVCDPDEIKQRRGPFAADSDLANVFASALRIPILPDEDVRRVAGVGLKTLENRSEIVVAPVVQTREPIQEKTATWNPAPRKGRLARWLFPEPSDRRNAEREPMSEFAAHFWTGGPPTAHAIRDISSTGLYVVTPERWYPGTVVRMTLTKSDGNGKGVERSICVRVEVVRWGNDGVGLRFVPQNARSRVRGEANPLEGADEKELDQFLKLVRGENG